MTNVFSTQPFLESVAAARFAGVPCAIETFQLSGHHFRLLSVRGRPVVTLPWLDFHEPLAGHELESASSRRVTYLPHVALGAMSSAEWQSNSSAAPRGRPSPYIDWQGFPAFSDFRTRDASQGSNSLRKMRHLEKTFPTVRYCYQDDDPSAIARCIAWKRAQYRASGFGDALADAANVQLLRELHDRGLLIVSTLRGGETILAVHIGLIWQRRFYWYIPAYDPAHARLSPGRLLLERLLEDSHSRGHHEFDFLLGDEAYKWNYATHTRVIGPLGEAPLSLRVRGLAKRELKRALQLSPTLWDMAQRMRRRLRAV